MPGRREENSGWSRRLTCLLLTALILLLTPRTSARAADSGDGGSARRQLVITVVEEIPAEEIEEEAVPLAAVPDTASGRETRHAGMMGLTLAAVIFYVLYFGRYERKLLALRREAARAESDFLRRIRTENEA